MYLVKHDSGYLGIFNTYEAAGDRAALESLYYNRDVVMQELVPPHLSIEELNELLVKLQETEEVSGTLQDMEPWRLSEEYIADKEGDSFVGIHAPILSNTNVELYLQAIYYLKRQELGSIRMFTNTL